MAGVGPIDAGPFADFDWATRGPSFLGRSRLLDDGACFRRQIQPDLYGIGHVLPEEEDV